MARVQERLVVTDQLVEVREVAGPPAQAEAQSAEVVAAAVPVAAGPAVGAVVPAVAGQAAAGEADPIGAGAAGEMIAVVVATSPARATPAIVCSASFLLSKKRSRAVTSPSRRDLSKRWSNRFGHFGSSRSKSSTSI